MRSPRADIVRSATIAGLSVVIATAAGFAGAAAPRAGVEMLVEPARATTLEAAPGGLTAAGPVPGRGGEPIALVGGTVHPISGPRRDGATILIGTDGRIEQIGPAGRVPEGYRRVDVSGLEVYPSLIHADTVLGLIEIGAVRATRDYAEVGDINPNARAEVSVNPSSELIPVARSSGILVAATAPTGGLISGTSAVIELDGWTWEDMVVLAPAALMVNWPSMSVNRSPRARRSAKEQVEQRDERLALLHDTFASARAYRNGLADGDPRERDVKWDAMARVLDREIPILVRANSLMRIRAALEWAATEHVRIIIEGGVDAWRVADELARRDVPVIVGNVLSMPRDSEPFDVNYRTPQRLHEAGVRFAIVPRTGGRDAGHARNLPWVAAKAVAYGLPADAALKALTLWPAEILGVADRLGSIEPGKDGTLIVTDGDPLDGRTSVHQAFIRGRPVDLTDRQKRLYERYRRKPRGDGPTQAH